MRFCKPFWEYKFVWFRVRPTNLKSGIEITILCLVFVIWFW